MLAPTLEPLRSFVHEPNSPNIRTLISWPHGAGLWERCKLPSSFPQPPKTTAKSSTVYPQHHVRSPRRSLPVEEEKVFDVTPAQLLARMSSAGAPAGDCEHPLFRTRSGMRWKASVADGDFDEGSNDEPLARTSTT